MASQRCACSNRNRTIDPISLSFPQKIFLIGMPGSGKTTLGKALASRLSYLFIDLDDVITTAENRSIAHIFDQEGEAYFRLKEHECLLHATGAHAQFVMACGGGTPCFHDNMLFIRQSGFSIFLDLSLSIIRERVTSNQGEVRPLIKSMEATNLDDALAQKYQRRLPYYQQADLRIGTVVSADDLVGQIAIG